MPLATLMRLCLLLEVLTHLALALTRTGWVAFAIMVVFGAYAFVWSTVSQTVRMRAVPMEFQGRVGSVYVVGLFLGLVIGQALGGVIADRWGLTAPFWFAFVGSGITLAAGVAPARVHRAHRRADRVGRGTASGLVWVRPQ